jgi:hypothetical protein
MHADRTNRIMLLLLALLFIAVGLGAGAASVGAFGTFAEHSRLTANPVGHFIGSAAGWLWPVTAAAATILVVLALRWLLALLFSTDRSGDLPIRSPGLTGRTTLAAGALTEAVAEEIESYVGVYSARARLIGNGQEPELVVAATLEETADLPVVRQRIETGALSHARSALGSPSLPIQLHLAVTARSGARVS